MSDRKSRLRRRGAWIGGILVVILAGLYFTPAGSFLVHAPSVGAGVAAEVACAGVFVSERPFDDAQSDAQRLSPLTAGNRYTLDRADQSVTVTALGLAKRTAIYRPGIGCTLLVNSTPEQLRRQAEGNQSAVDGLPSRAMAGRRYG